MRYCDANLCRLFLHIKEIYVKNETWVFYNIILCQKDAAFAKAMDY